MVIKEVKQTIQVIEKKGEDKFRGISKAKSFRGWLNGLIGKYANSGNVEWEFGMREVLNAYNHFNPESIVPVEIKEWHGKSSFEIVRGVDRIVIIKYQKPNRGSEQKRIETEMSGDEIEALISAIKIHWRGEPIKTSRIALIYSMKLGLGHATWKEFFADRKNHNKLTLLLDAFQELGLIRYNGGLTEVLDNNLSIQKILK